MNIRRPVSNQLGMMLLEVLIAILVFAIGVLGMVKMQAVAAANSVNSEDRATAALLANDAIGMLWASKSSTLLTADSTAWQSQLTNSGLRGVVGSVNASTDTPPITTVVITWNRQLGRNVEFGVNSTTDPEKTATYSTQVIINQLAP